MNKKIDFDKYKKIFSHIIEKDEENSDKILLTEEAVRSMIYYSGSVIVGRSIPDLRDGLKPSQRRLLYTMKTLGISFTGGFKKSARITGSTIGLFHPHGDIAAYDTLVGMTQDWKLNCPLIDGQGNFGSIDGDSPASQRYTESRMTKFGASLFKDLDKDTVDFRPNYDGQEIEPEVLPAPYPNIIINGVLQGSIAVGMASSILPHNPNEVMDVIDLMLIKRKKKQSITPEEVLELMPAPDFPTGGYVYNTGSMIDIIKKGKGSVRIRSKHHIEDLKRGKKAIIITEIPWMYEKTSLIQQLVDLKRNSEKDNIFMSSITNIIDNSDKNMRIIIELKSGIDPESVWNYILKNTKFDTSVPCFAVVIDKEENIHEEISPTPKEYGLLEILERYLDHRFLVVVRKYKSILKTAQERTHIIDGLLKAISMIDKIISIIRSSEEESKARESIRELGFSRLQTKAILNIRLAKLVSLEKMTLEKEREDLSEVIEKAKGIVEDDKKQIRELTKEFKEVRKLISRERRSVIKSSFEDIVINDITPKEDCSIIITHNNYVKRINKKDVLRLAKNNKPLIELNHDDYIIDIFETNTTSIMIFVMESGQVYGIKAYDITDSNTGSYIENILEINPKDKVIQVLEVDEFNEDNVLTMLTTSGMIKKSSLSLYKGAMRKPGITGINLKDNTSVLAATITKNCKGKQPDIIIITAHAKSIRFNLEAVSCVGRASQGVVAIKIKDDDKLIGMKVFEDDNDLIITISQSGMTKIVKASTFKLQGRSGLGMICMGLTKKSGYITHMISWSKDENSILNIKDENGIIFSKRTSEIENTGKNIKGSQLFEIKENSKITDIYKVKN